MLTNDAVPILRKKAPSILPFSFFNTSSQMTILIYSTYRFLLQPPQFPPTLRGVNQSDMFFFKMQNLH